MIRRPFHRAAAIGFAALTLLAVVALVLALSYAWLAEMDTSSRTEWFFVAFAAVWATVGAGCLLRVRDASRRRRHARQ